MIQTSSFDVISTLMGVNVFTFSSFNDFFNSFRASRLRAMPIVWIPVRARAAAIPRPKPVEAPVTRAILPLRCGDGFSSKLRQIENSKRSQVSLNLKVTLSQSGIVSFQNSIELHVSFFSLFSHFFEWWGEKVEIFT